MDKNAIRLISISDDRRNWGNEALSCLRSVENMTECILGEMGKELEYNFTGEIRPHLEDGCKILLFRFKGVLLGEGAFLRWKDEDARRCMIYRPTKKYRTRVRLSKYLNTGKNWLIPIPSRALRRIRQDARIVSRQRPPKALDLIPPKRKRFEITRVVRDTQQTKVLKVMYKNQCQVCGTMISLADGNPYSEVHHVRPLGMKGPDTTANMLVLCPNHHAEFDFSATGIARDGKTVLKWREGALKKSGKLRLQRNHVLDNRLVGFQYELLAKAGEAAAKL